MARTLIEERKAATETVRLELRKLIRLSEITQRDIENQYGYGKGYLSQVLNGSIALTVRHVFNILGGLKIAPESFFAHVEDRRREATEREATEREAAEREAAERKGDAS